MGEYADHHSAPHPLWGNDLRINTSRPPVTSGAMLEARKQTVVELDTNAGNAVLAAAPDPNDRPSPADYSISVVSA